MVGWSRLLIGGASLMCLATFALAIWLTPDPSGSGTHQQLGFPPCTIKSLFQIPCPTCGMTTSFAHFVRGEWSQAARANASGLILACWGAMFVPWSIVSWYRKEYWRITRPDLWCFGILCGWMLISLLEWSLRHLLLPRWNLS